MFYSAISNAFFPDEMREDYEAAGTWPDDAIEVTQTEWGMYGLGEAPEGMQRAAGEDGRPMWLPTPPPTIEELSTRKRAEIEAAMDAELAKGMPYTMPDGTPEIVQTRPEDESNLLGLGIEARDLLVQGVTEPTQYIRVESNAMYQLTPQQMIDLTNATKSHKLQLLNKSWLFKDAIETALETEDREAIEAITW